MCPHCGRLTTPEGIWVAPPDAKKAILVARIGDNGVGTRQVLGAAHRTLERHHEMIPGPGLQEAHFLVLRVFHELFAIIIQHFPDPKPVSRVSVTPGAPGALALSKAPT
jgi:hypothetical protein